MKTINLYFQAVTKVSMAHLVIEDHENIEDYMRQWSTTGFAKVHYMSEKIYIYIPWNSIVYCQYKDGHNIHGE